MSWRLPIDRRYSVFLGGGFVLLLLIAITGGGLIVLYGARIQDSIQLVQRGHARSVQLAGSAEADVNLLRVYVRDLVYGIPDQGRRPVRSQIDSVLAVIDGTLAEYGALLTEPEEKENFRRFSSAFSGYRKELGAVMAATEKGDRAEARSMLAVRLAPWRKRMSDAMQLLAGGNERVSSAIDRQVDALQERFLWLSGGILVASILVGVFIYRYVVKSFRENIESIAGARAEKERLLELLTERQKRIEDLVLDLQTSTEEQRKRFAQELHDAIGHGLTTAIFNIESALADSAKRGTCDARHLENALQSIVEVSSEAKRISYELRPPIIDDFGLERALMQLATDFENRTGIKVQTKLDAGAPHLSPRVEISLYRIVQEALTNIEKHAEAGHVILQAIRRDDGTVALSISDDGRGFDAGKLRADGGSHLGIRHIRERVELIGGTAIIDSIPGKGSEINIEVPSGATKDKA